MTGSPTAFIKGEPEDSEYASIKFNGGSGPFGYSFNQANGDIGSINPSDVMSGNTMNNQYNSHMSNSFVADDELLDLAIDGDANNFNSFGNFNSNQAQPFSINPQIYSHTPDTQPIASPFSPNYDFSSQYNQMNQRTGFSQSIPTNISTQNGMYPRGLKVERQVSDSRTPMTPRTPNMAALHLGHSLGATPDSLQQQAMMNQQLHNQARMHSQNWLGSGSAQSWDDESLASPHSLHHMQHPQISELIGMGKHASMPAKMETGGMLGMQSQEAKKKRRRESHNAVERRRRDNINERISDLSKLVPQHRLEDEKVKKHISNNGPMSPSFGPAGGISPPNATSLLAGGIGKRAAGNITQGLPLEDKDKGPNKGDILNGSVSWMRDLMWLLYTKMQQEQQLKQYIESLGGQWPLEQSVDEVYMRTEVQDSIERNGEHNFHYSRTPGTGLRVPRHTNIAGEPVSPGQQDDSEGFGHPGQHHQYWANSANRTPFSLKEEDEGFGMELN